MERQVAPVVLTALLLACLQAGVARADAPTMLRAIRHITTPAMTRLIIEFSAPVHYRMQRVAGRSDLGVPARLYVDVLDTHLSDPTLFTAALDEGPLLRLRGTQVDAHTARVILDVPGLSEYGAFPMPDPFRLIIDVRGTPRTGPPRAAPRPDTALASVPPTPAGPSRSPRGSSPGVRRRFKVVIDPGHGGKDPGAIGVDGTAEKDVVLVIAQRLKTRLAAEPDIDVVLTRESDVFLALEERTARANAEQADLFVSIHANASPNPRLSGVETYYLNNTNDRATIRLAEMENGLRTVTGGRQRDHDVALILSDLIQSYKIQESVALAGQIQRSVVGSVNGRGAPVNDLGVKRGPFYVLVGAGMPCVLAEVSFLTNPEEGARLAHPAYQEMIAEGLLRGIRQFVENARVAENL